MIQFIPYRKLWEYLFRYAKRHGIEEAFVRLHLVLGIASYDTLGIWLDEKERHSL